MASATKHKPRSSPPKKPKAAGKRSGKPRAAKAATGKAAPANTAATAEFAFAGLESPERSAPPLAEVDADVLEFIEALDRFKKQNGRPFPSWSEVLLVVRQLGYVRK